MNQPLFALYLVCLFIFFCYLQHQDLWSTLANLSRPNGKEHNKFLEKLFERYGPYHTLIVVKVLMAFVYGAACLVAYFLTEGRDQKILLAALMIVALGYLLLVRKNKSYLK